MAHRLDGKIAVVTGAASGMGRAVALDFLKEGAKIIAADINEARLAELVQEASEMGYGDNIRTSVCNIVNVEDCERTIQFCVDSFGGCNVLSHNAGIIGAFKLVDELDEATWDRCLAVNLTGSMHITRAALQYFVKTETKANIVMVTSNAAFESCTGDPAYTASKAGANALMKTIAFEYGRHGIRCNSICPGPVRTHIGESKGQGTERGMTYHFQTGYNAHQAEWTGRTNEKMALPTEISPLAVFLASDESSFINSESVIIDGGVCLSC